ncbi:MAG: hypothetical protein GWN00_32575, partial [Aliifodinibius sp.]|nr:hypothetical protein [Fodinibius sp.]NIV12783.1 hypothetical protein [Fodinibius sp.]NIY29353.1 hypothetical protein [Fodinibius sp.]
IYGDIGVPYPVPQLSNANTTVIARLDADDSDDLQAQKKTIGFFIDMAKETGVVPLYAWVSSKAALAGWQYLTPLGQALEEVGGFIGTHSKYHNIDEQMTPERWEEELDESVKEISSNMIKYGHDINNIKWLINPGEEIHLDKYEEIARRFSFFMTHGPEEYMPLGYGNFTWYMGPCKNLVTVQTAPSSDWHWFYEKGWNFTTAQITAYEETIFDHIYQNISRGVLFNLMWHDYSITSKSRYRNQGMGKENHYGLYQGMKA